MSSTEKGEGEMKSYYDCDAVPVLNIKWENLQFRVGTRRKLKRLTHPDFPHDFTAVILHVNRDINILAMRVSRFVERSFQIDSTLGP